MTRRDNVADIEWPLSGRCQPVLALHAAASSGGQWDGLADYIGGRYNVVAPHLPGYGDARLQGSPGVVGMAEQFASEIAANGEPAHIVGHSLGAAVALEIAIARPDLVRSLTLIEPMAFQLLREGDRSDMALHLELRDLADRMTTAFLCRNHEDAMKDYVNFWYGGHAWNRTGVQLKKELAQYAGQVTLDLGASLVDTRLVQRCSELYCPTLLIMALNSPLASLRVTELAAWAIPGARLIMIPDAGHMVPLTDPHVINPLISEHLKSASRADVGQTGFAARALG